MSNIIPQKQGIPFKMFKLMSLAGSKYSGHVEEFGYVYWIDKEVPLKLPDNFPVMPQTKTTYITVSQMIVEPYAQPDLLLDIGQTSAQKPQKDSRNKSEWERFKELSADLLSGIATTNNAYGTVNSYLSLSNKLITIPAKYKQVNKRGSLVKTSSRYTIRKGDRVLKASTRILYFGIAIDAGLAFAGEQSWDKTRKNIYINIGIYALGRVCAPLGAAWGTMYFIYGLFDDPDFGQSISYIEAHGSITPADNTRVYNPYMR